MAQIEILKENSIYRLSDLIQRKGVRWQQDRNRILEDPAYNGTVLYDYLTNMANEDDWITLKAVVERHAKRYLAPSDNELVVHLRLGDIMAESEEFKSRSFHKSLRVYGAFDIDLPNAIEKVTIVTALHFGANELNGKYFYSEQAHERSLEVIEALKAILLSRGLPLNIQSSSKIDMDFCYLVGARYLVKSFSQMSELAQKCLSTNSMVWSPPKGQRSIKFVRA